jgi:AraC-like DNA-binding protein
MITKNLHHIITHGLLIALLFVSTPLWSQQTVSDTLVEGRMTRYDYQGAAKAARTKLSNAHLSIHEKLYYTNRLSMAEFRLMHLDVSMALALQSLKLSKQATDSALIVNAWKVTAYSYNYTGKLDSALVYSERMMMYGKRHGDIRATRDAMASVATILAQNKRFEEALKYYREIEKLSIKIRDESYYPSGEYNIGLMYLQLEKYDSCVVRLKKAAVLASKCNNLDLLSLVYGVLSDCYMTTNNKTEWKKNRMISFELSRKIGNMRYMAMDYCAFLDFELRNKNYKDALTYGRKAIGILKKNPYPVLEIRVDSMMYKASKGAGLYADALTYHESFVNRRRTVDSENEKALLHELVVKNNVMEKDLTIAQQKIEIERNRRTVQLSIIAIIVVILIIIAAIIYTMRTHKFRHRLYLKEKELDGQMKEIQHWIEWKQNKGIGSETDTSAMDSEPSTEEKATTKRTQVSLYNELHELFSTQKLHLNPDLDIEAVIKVLGTNKKYLYHAISENSEDNFRNFINRYRVNDAKEIIEQKIMDKASFNIADIYTQTGFNSSVTFYRAFKSVTGLTPKEYSIEFTKELEEEEAKYADAIV